MTMMTMNRKATRQDNNKPELLVQSHIVRRYSHLDFKLGTANIITARKCNVFYIIPLIRIQLAYDLHTRHSRHCKWVVRHLIFLKAIKLRRTPPARNLIRDTRLFEACFRLFPGMNNE